MSGKSLRPCRLALLSSTLVLCLAATKLLAGSYDLNVTKGMEGFRGSTAARELLARNGFVVADPAFKQIFEPYIESPTTEPPSAKNPLGVSVPAFITVDSAWDTYHFLLEEGVNDLEEIQAPRLARFSRRLLARIKEQAQGPDEKRLASFASIGLAFQDKDFRRSLAPEEKRIVDELLDGAAPVVVPVGFPLSPAQFRAQSFYARSSELTQYFAARQWYAGVVFRLSNSRETELAVTLATLIIRNPDLMTLWTQLSNPYDRLLGPAEDGTVPAYAEVTKAVLGGAQPGAAALEKHITDIQTELAQKVPAPLVNDQLLSPDQYADFPKVIKGFRLLPPRRVPSAVCFQNTTDPKIPRRLYPSGLDFLAASPVLHSAAAARAVESQFGKDVAEVIQKADCGPMPDSLHGDALRLLANLQAPLPPQAAPALRTEAWADKQLWTQLGAWAEQRHTWALHTKINEGATTGMVVPPIGTVAPYPGFFAGLARLTRQTAAALEQTGLDQPFEVKKAAGDLLNLLNLSKQLESARNETEFERNASKLVQLQEFQNRYYEEHQAELKGNGSEPIYRKLQTALEDLARRCAATGKANEADTKTLATFYECRTSVVHLLNNFAPVCDRLAQLARKSLASEPLTDDDAKWMRNYGITLAGFHFYYGNSYEVPLDNFPVVTRIFACPLTGSSLYAGLARPQALYIILPSNGALQLYRGAVMTYREFVRPDSYPLNDDSWREMVSKGQTPPAPPFTRSFCAETSVQELMNKLQVLSTNVETDYGDLEEVLWEINSRATQKDLPDLLDMLKRTGANEDIMDGLAEIIARLPWESRQAQLVEFLAAPESRLADAAARILVHRPAALDTSRLVSGFSHQPVRTRRLYCAILGRLPRQTEATRKLLLQALRDAADGVRWQAALAIGKARWDDAQSRAALRERLDDTNELVAAAVVHALVQLHSTNEAPVLLAKLKTRLQRPAVASEYLSPQASAIMGDHRGEGNEADAILDAGDLRLDIEATVPPTVLRMAAMRLPPRPVNFPTHDYNLADALIRALGDLGYAPATNVLFKLRGTEYDSEATLALSKLAPDRLADELIAVAMNKQTDSYVREKAMVTLCNISTTNRVRGLVPLLEDTTPIIYSRPLPGPPWRICDRAAESIARLLGWQRGFLPFVPPQQREKILARAKAWADSARQHD